MCAVLDGTGVVSPRVPPVVVLWAPVVLDAAFVVVLLGSAVVVLLGEAVVVVDVNDVGWVDLGVILLTCIQKP